MTDTTLATNNAHVAARIADGQRLHIGITLSYVGGSSDKFWSAVWAENQIAVHFGPHGYSGTIQMQSNITTVDQGAKKMWDLMRKKVGKGYTVVDAAIIAVPPSLHPNLHTVRAERMIDTWNGIRDARAARSRRPLLAPELLGTSSRTPAAGAQVLLDIISPTPPLETLMAAAVADPTERFLPPIVMSRPDVPEEAKFLAALAGTATVTI